jgi:hypothetical protein
LPDQTSSAQSVPALAIKKQKLPEGGFLFLDLNFARNDFCQSGNPVAQVSGHGALTKLKGGPKLE